MAAMLALAVGLLPVACGGAPGASRAAAATSTPAAPEGPEAPEAPPAAAPGRAAAYFEAGAITAGAALPDAIARGLSTDARVLECSAGVVAGRSAFRPDWVAAHRGDLDGDGADDWIVEGRHGCLTGPAGAAWWVYAGDPEGPRLLGALGEAHSLEILPGARPGFADLRLRRAGDGVRLLRHDGSAYVPVAAPAR